MEKRRKDRTEETVSFTVVTRTDGRPVSKIISPDGQGGITKQASANISQGTMKRVAIPFKDFGPFIRSMKNNQGIVHGVPVNHGGDDYQEFDFGLVGQENPPSRLSRSQKYLAYPTDTAFICMFDHDPKPEQNPISPEDFIEAICKEVPDFANCPTWHTPSTSSCIYDLNGKELSGQGSGFHLYFPFSDPTALPSFVAILFRRLWLGGHGYILVTRSGAMLERTIFDAAVFSPERLDFVSGAVCQNCYQRLPDPVFRIGKEVIIWR
jgi:hypothetical protein